MAETIPQREDRRRELALWILVSADMSGVEPELALSHFERAFVAPIPPATAREATEHYRIERFEDYLPEPDEWQAARPALERMVTEFARRRTDLDAAIVAASPRWRLDRMPVIDRTLLRIGVLELVFTDKPRARATINSLIELAKRFGSETTPAFVNGILDQIRRDRGIPFT